MATLPRSVHVLSALFGLSGIAGVVVVAAASVVGFDLSGRAGLATLPVALSLVGTMSATLPISRLMARHGRRVGFLLGTATATLGASLGALAIALGNFPLFCFGSFLVGTLQGVAPYYRFAAVELAAPAVRSRAVAAVLLGGVAAGVVGPPLGAAARLWAPAAPFVGSYVLLMLVGFLLMILLAVVKLPAPVARQAAVGGRRLGEIARDRRFVAAVLGAAIAAGAMVFTMVAAPLSMKHANHSFAETAAVIQAHVVAMFLPALFSGRLVERWGTGRMMGVGLAAIMGSVLVNLAGISVAHHWIALVLIGVGWNFLFVSGSTLLTTTHSEAEKGTAQGFNDLFISSTAATSALAAGPAHAALGWSGLNAIVAVAALAAAAALVVLVRHRPAPAPGAAA